MPAMLTNFEEGGGGGGPLAWALIGLYFVFAGSGVLGLPGVLSTKG